MTEPEPARSDQDGDQADSEAPAHALSAAEVLQALGTTDRGLSGSEAAQRQSRFGPNRLDEEPPEPRWKRFLAQFRDLVVLILIAAAVISGAMGEWVDTLAILAIVVLNAAFGFLQEDRASRALAALRSLSSPSARVLRDGASRTIPAQELVPGDLVALEAGDHVPADLRLIRGYALKVQEAALTGESVPVEKQPESVLPAETALGDRRNMAYMGTIVATGKADAVVVATGMQAELGRIAGMLRRETPGPTPLQRRLEELGRVLLVACLAAVLVIFVLQWMRGEPMFQAFLLAVSLAVAAVPEGLPAVVTAVLAIGLQRMARRNTLVRKLSSVETLGSVTVICSDKTGTLTRNEMTVRELAVAGRRYQVSGVGYEPKGTFEPIGGEAGDDPPAALRTALEIGAYCNNATITPRADGSGAWDVVGDPTEGALLVAARKAGIEPPPDHRVLHEVPFDAGRRMMSVVVGRPDGTSALYVKGAAEAVLPQCTAELGPEGVRPLDSGRVEAIHATDTEMASRALRVLAVAYRDRPQGLPVETYENDLVFAGLIGMIDPPRDDAKAAIRACRRAGIRPVMITGDHPATARAIAQELGLLGRSDHADLLTGNALETMTAEDLAARVEETAVYARATAEHKLRIIAALKARRHVVAMTGDGVNDAPAVKAADIGIAMGRTGTDVTREASSMVLVDDSFASIVHAIEEGRAIFANIRKVIDYLLSCNVGEVALMLTAAVIGLPAPLTPIQILWINLVTDGLPALALGMERPEKDTLARPPRPSREPIITRAAAGRIVSHGLLIASAPLAAFWLAAHVLNVGLDGARTVAFFTMALSQLFYAFGCRSARHVFPQMGLLTNGPLLVAIAISALLQMGAVAFPWTRTIFDTSLGTGRLWVLTVALSLVPVTVIEVVKLVRAAWRRRSERRCPG